MSIHLGWTVGNGLFGVASNSVKCMELYGLAKIVLGALTCVQTMSLGERLRLCAAAICGID